MFNNKEKYYFIFITIIDLVSIIIFISLPVILLFYIFNYLFRDAFLKFRNKMLDYIFQIPKDPKKRNIIAELFYNIR